MGKGLRLMAGALLAGLLLGQPNPAAAKSARPSPYSATQIKDAGKSLKYCTRKGYLDGKTDEIYLMCARNAVMVGDLALAQPWRDTAARMIEAQQPDQRKQAGTLLRVTGELAYARGDWLAARNAWRELVRNQLALDVLSGDSGDYRQAMGMARELEARLQDRALEDTLAEHPEIYVELKSLLEEARGWFNDKPKPTDWAPFTARAQRVLAADPRNELGHYVLALMDHLRGDCPALIRDAQAAIDASRYDNQAAMMGAIGNCHTNNGRYEAALKAYGQAIESDPSRASFRSNRDTALEWLEKRDHPTAFDLYAAARDSQLASSEETVAAWDKLNQSLTLSPNFPLALALRSNLYNRNFKLSLRADEEGARTRHAVDADAMKAYALNPESLKSALAMGEVYFRKPKSEFPETLWRAMQWYNLVRTRDPQDAEAEKRYQAADAGRWQLTPEQEQQRQADAAAFAARLQEVERIKAEARKRDNGGFSDRMQAWCDSIGASNIRNMAAVPPACYGFIRN